MNKLFILVVVVVVLLVPLCVFGQQRNGPYPPPSSGGSGGITNKSGVISSGTPFQANSYFPFMSYGVTNPFDALGFDNFPQYRGNYAYSTVIGMYTNSSNPTNYFFKAGGSTWTFGYVTNDSSLTTGTNYVWYLGVQDFPTNDPSQWLVGNVTAANQFDNIAGNIFIGTFINNSNVTIGLNILPNSETSIGGSSSSANQILGNLSPIVSFYDNFFAGTPNSQIGGMNSSHPAGWLGGMGDEQGVYANGNQSYIVPARIVSGNVPPGAIATNVFNAFSDYFFINGVMVEKIRYKAVLASGNISVYEYHELHGDPNGSSWEAIDQHGHVMLGHINPTLGDAGTLFSPAYTTFYGGNSNSATGAGAYWQPNVMIARTSDGGLPTLITNGGVNGDGINVFVDQGGTRGSIVANTLVPKIPTAVTLTGSVFTFSNSTPNPLECYFSGSVAYAVAKNGVAVFGSLASDGYMILQPTNKCAITYTVAPTMFTNAF